LNGYLLEDSQSLNPQKKLLHMCWVLKTNGKAEAKTGEKERGGGSIGPRTSGKIGKKKRESVEKKKKK